MQVVHECAILCSGAAWLSVDSEIISLKPLLRLTPDKWTNLSKKMQILHIFLHTEACDYLTYFAYLNMQNMPPLPG
jgi:hypothetical protein